MLAMASTTYTFDENKFISEFVRNYYNDYDFDLTLSFNEYYQNFIMNNSHEFNLRLILKFYITEVNPDDDISLGEYLYIKLYDIIQKAMNH